MYHAVETDPMLPRSPVKPEGAGSGSVRAMRLEHPTRKCNDWFFAVLFVAHVITIAVFAFWKGIPAVIRHVKDMGDDADSTPDGDFSKVYMLGSILVAIAVGLSAFWMRFLMAYATYMIKVALWFNVGLLLVFAFTSFSVNPYVPFLFILLAVVNVCYIYYVRNRIAFASANLRAASAAISAHMGVFLVALAMIVKQILWIGLWSLSAVGVYQQFMDSDPDCAETGHKTPAPGDISDGWCGGTPAVVTLFFMLISLYWGQQVIQNVLTCTTAGVVATWWYQPHAERATFASMYRALTTSFGSICFGSLIVAILEAMRAMASLLKEKAAEEDNMVLACVACMAECILGCLESLMEYFNKWAYVYVGVYGYSFRTSGKAVMDLFANRGWTAVINDDLTGGALTFGAVGVGCVGAVIGLMMVKFSPDAWFAALSSQESAYGILAGVGFVSGLSMAMVLANVVITAVHTVFVCFAEDPIAFSRNHPSEYETLVSAWREFQGDALLSAYGTAV
ncbi:hypothetical protein Poli38472_009370 [Pythium oligandrum]|uniref:Choline transporter-like protein n=1 Tax=Pythium oligandrum TaxID=41045 RepID=A0A8K1FP23_PYTOL|nr:hypothetical protein Poli38472_009370 [Pythium oligandrum]|eukprot:TMW65203.1 hypothetical protein Poli38472_009370 [Pythium oligandrum]